MPFSQLALRAPDGQGDDADRNHPEEKGDRQAQESIGDV
jgi:hypothetical protein